jgi:hypothetical protein
MGTARESWQSVGVRHALLTQPTPPMKKIVLPRLLAAIFAAGLSVASLSATTLNFTDFIPDNSRVGFMGFEALPVTDFSGGVALTYQEGGILIEQVNGGPNDIWTTYFTPEGERGWYPNAGDFGYTRLTLTSGEDFQNVGFLLGTGRLSAPSFATYALMNDGVAILTGSLDLTGVMQQYLGFGGGGFDEVWLREQIHVPGEFLNGTENGLAIDAIEISNVPDHDLASVTSLAALLSALAAFKRRARAWGG